jgi:hypothetical protein
LGGLLRTKRRWRPRPHRERGVTAVSAVPEGVIAELKNQHALGRVRRRGTPAFHAQFLLGSAAINLKRFAKHAPSALERLPATPQASAAISSANDRRERFTQRPSIQFGRQRLIWTASVCLN